MRIARSKQFPSGSLVAVLLAACLVTPVLAANDKVSATYESLGANGVAGHADLNPMPQGGTFVSTALRGLAPGVEYAAVIYQQSGSCAAGGPSTEILRFTANKAGNANFAQKVTLDLSNIHSIGILRTNDNTAQACASVSP